ncbi:3-deoxy-7-phosphoheptulonate synthase [Buchnera aphidicola]|uniref:3-deoxy-7-phosphoheptulonate synthase n=1 Tax=Buchnera aphidicola TaxID=9 RepID=UPI0031B69894
MKNIDNLNIFKMEPLITRKKLLKKYPVTKFVRNLIIQTRRNIKNILLGKDKRLLVIIGPCSLHNVESSIEYAKKLYELRKKFSSRLEIVMRTYFEKPRTVIGWKGLITDPYLDGSLKINDGLEISRNLLLKINMLGMPAATEFLDMVISHFLTDLISWGAIGARTTESQIHREMASSLLCPIGFKNGTDGNINIAIDAIRASKRMHLFLNSDENGIMNINYTLGNTISHIIMRGGKIPNYYSVNLKDAVQQLNSFKLPPYLMVDFSHSNSLKNYKRQLDVAESIMKQITDGANYISGVMIESFLKEGSQNISDTKNLKYGISITDACLGWQDSEYLLSNLFRALKIRF